MNTIAMPRAGADSQAAPDGAAAGIGLWVFMAVATSLFSLFIAAYVMRMSQTDWTAIAMPWQLWLSTALLAAGSVLLQQHAAGHQQRGAEPQLPRHRDWGPVGLAHPHHVGCDEQ